MIKKEVSFILPNNSKIDMNYNEVEEYCKSICLLDKNKEEFSSFAEDYSYFTPYFDFIMFKLNYIFINANFSDMELFHIDNALYLYPANLRNYEESFNRAKTICNESFDLPFMTSVSDKELGITTCSTVDTKDVLIDPCLYGMMSKSGTISGSHGITATTVLNQLLIKSKTVYDHYFEYISFDNDLFSDPINFLVKNIGFIRATSFNINPMLIGNTKIMEETQLNFIRECEKSGYRYWDSEVYASKSLVKEYKKTIKKD